MLADSESIGGGLLLMLRLLLIIAVGLTMIIPFPVRGSSPPEFIIFTPGFWGSMDKLPTKDPAWLENSPYPHYRKHQDADFLTGPDYRPIPQKYQALGEGPSATKLLLCSYRLMEKEFSFWGSRINKRASRELIKIFDDWQILEDDPAGIGDINVIYLKYDWRLDLPLMCKHYAAPLLELIERKWPEAEIHWIGHSLGGLFGRYVATEYPKRLASLISIGGPQYGIYEIGCQRRGERVTFGGRGYIERSQEIGLYLAERFFFGDGIVKMGTDFIITAKEFADRYTPITRRLDPSENLLSDGFGTSIKLSDAVPKNAIAIYGLGYGSYDFEGIYHPEILCSDRVGPTLEPGPEDLRYAFSGDGRVDPFSARGPFAKTICLGKDLPHGNLMRSPLVLTLIIDRYFFDGRMSKPDVMLEFRRTGVAWEEKDQFYDWLLKTRQVWD